MTDTLRPTDTLEASAPIQLPTRTLTLLLLVVGLSSLLLLSLALGSVRIPLDEILVILTGGEATKSTWATIVLQVRLPKATTAILAGAALGVSGLLMQTFFRNPLASPFILGISSGASLGVAIVVLASGTIGAAMLTGTGIAGDFTRAIAAGFGAGITLLIVLAVAQVVRNSMTLLILGLMFGYLTSAIVSLLLYFAIPERIQTFIRWTFGSFSGTTWQQIIVFAPLILIGLVGALMLAKTLNALLLGEDYARSMGVAIGWARFWIIAITAILAGTVTAFCGPVGFIGIAVPHLCRSLLNTSDHRLLLPATLLMGAIVALLASLIAELPMLDIVLPLNAVTSLLGAPIVIIVILRRQNIHQAF